MLQSKNLCPEIERLLCEAEILLLKGKTDFDQVRGEYRYSHEHSRLALERLAEAYKTLNDAPGFWQSGENWKRAVEIYSEKFPWLEILFDEYGEHGYLGYCGLTHIQ